jgi:membrane protein
MNFTAILELFKETFSEWSSDKASRLAAALAYYTIFSIAPLLIIVIAVVGAVYGEAAARGTIVQQIQGLVGEAGAELIETAIQNASQPQTGTIASILSIILLLFGATGLFTELQDALNTIWEVQPKRGSAIKNLIRKRLLSFGMVVAIGFLLLASLLITAVLEALIVYFNNLIPGLDYFWQLVNLFVGFAITTVLFGLIFKVLPDVKITWGDVLIGSVITSVFFSIGRYVLGQYLGNSSFGSTYGAASSIVVLLAWIYYSAQILFFGAEFTQVYARRYGSKIVPDENAVPIIEEEGTNQGTNSNTNAPPRKQSSRKKSSSNWLSRLTRSLTKSKRIKRNRNNRH